MKHIDSEKLIVEIQKLIDIIEKRINNNAPIEHPETIDEENLEYLQKTRESKITWLDGQEEALKKVKNFLDTLEVKEVDLENEIEDVKHNYKVDDNRHTSICSADIEWLAEHFYKLGLNARKEG